MMYLEKKATRQSEAGSVWVLDIREAAPWWVETAILERLYIDGIAA
jgi:hypothetical protein